MTLEELRDQIDALDRQLVELLSERARAAHRIGRLKSAANKGPFPDIELTHIYERIIDVMRALQRDELASERNAQASAPGQGTGAEAPETGNKQ